MLDSRGAGARPRVFVSYTPDSPEHVGMVLEFATFLRVEAGVDARLDVWDTDARRDWSVWVLEHFDESDFVLVIASPEYKRVADENLGSTGTRGEELAAAVIRNNLARDPRGTLGRVLPVVLPGRTVDDVPELLCAHSTTHFAIREFTLDGTRALRLALSGSAQAGRPGLGQYVPLRAATDSVIVASTVTTSSEGPVLAAGAEVTLGARRYLVHADYLSARPLGDHSAIRRQARAADLEPPHEHVWLRQVEVLHRTPESTSALSDLDREHALLSALSGRDPGLPATRGMAAEGRVSTLAMTWPSLRNPAGSCCTLGAWLPGRGEVVDTWQVGQTLRRIAGLSRALTRLHDQGCAHRFLTPEGILLHDDGGLVLRDLGLAAVGTRPGEGPEHYRAPEQGHRGHGRTGPWTDVFQLAALTYHLVTGGPPVPGIPLPVARLNPSVPEQAAAAIDGALSADASRRPSITAFAHALRHTPGHR